MSDNKKKKGHKRLWIILIVVVVLLAAVRVLLPSVTSSSTADAGKVSADSTETVTRGSIKETAEGSGTIEAASTKAIALEYDGKLEKIYVETGDQVKTGDVLALYDTDALDTVIEEKESELSTLDSSISDLSKSGSSYITAPVSGRVKRIYAAVGDVAAQVSQTHGGLLEISADGKLKVEFTSSVTYLTEGDSVTVEFDSYSETGTVAEVDGQHVTVTIADDTDYAVDTVATVRGRSGEQIGTGELKSNHPYLVSADYGIIESVSVTKTSNVSKGDTLFVRKDVSYNQTYLDMLTQREELIDEIQALKAYQENPVVVSDADGYIVSMDCLEGMTYEKDQQLCTIADESTMNLKVEIDELEIDGVTVGQEAEVVFDAFEDKVYNGTVTKISGVGNNNGGVTTYTVTIELTGDTAMRNAMSATATLTTQERSDVLLVPVDAIESVDGQRYVTVVNADGSTEQRAITTGLSNQNYAEVTDGLSEGETVVLNSTETTDIFSAMMAQRSSNSPFAG